MIGDPTTAQSMKELSKQATPKVSEMTKAKWTKYRLVPRCLRVPRREKSDVAEPGLTEHRSPGTPGKADADVSNATAIVKCDEGNKNPGYQVVLAPAGKLLKPDDAVSFGSDEESTMVNEVFRFLLKDLLRSTVGRRDFTYKLMCIYNLLVGLNTNMHCNQWIEQRLVNDATFLLQHIREPGNEMSDDVAITKLHEMLFILDGWLPNQIPSGERPVSYDTQTQAMHYVRSMYGYSWFRPENKYSR